MSTSIEQRVVQMKFDNKQFEAGVAQSMSTLDKFKAKLNFKDAAKGFESISNAADQVSLSNLYSETDKVGAGFDAMAIIAISALNRITNEAITAGTKLVKSLSIDQVSAGWSKYEARTAAIQTLVNATGRSVEDIEKYMSKLMLYSDETSYGFADMTSALGTMVSAGGDIDKLVPVLEGFGNAVSFVGKGANEYSRAIIQLSQGYGRNALMLEDWKSIEQTLGGAKQLKEVFIEVGEELGKIQKGQIDVGTFNETLRNKWLDQEVIEEALGRFAEMTERAFEMIEAGEVETVAEAYEILSQTVDDYRIRAAKAAQEAKSFTEAIDATKDAVSTKWMESFQIIFGNYEEATKLWTELTNTLYEIFAAAGDTRNEILTVWKSLGGRDHMIRAFKAAFEALAKPVGAVRDAIKEIFFPGTVYDKGMWLVSATNGVRAFFKALILSDEAVTTLKKGVKLLLIPVYALYQILRIGLTIIGQTIITIFALADALLSLPAKINSVNNPLKKIFGDERYARMVAALKTIVDKLGAAFATVGGAIYKIGKSIASAFSSKLQTSISKLLEALSPIGGWILDRIVEGFEYLARFDYNKIVKWAIGALDSLVDGFEIILKWCGFAVGGAKEFFASFRDMTPIEILKAIGEALGNFKDSIVEFVKNLGFDKVFPPLIESGDSFLDVIKKLGKAMLDFIGKLTPAKILVTAFGVSLVWVFTQLAVAISAFTGIANGVTGVLNGVTGVLQGFQQRIKGSPILQIAVAITVLAVSLGALAQIDSNRLFAATKALGSLILIFGALIAVASIISSLSIKFPQIEKSLLTVSKSMLVMSAAVTMLSAALLALSFVDVTGIGVKLVILAGMLVALVASVKILSKSMGSGIGDAAYIIAFAVSLNLMVMALSKLTAVNLEDNIGTLATIGIIVAMMVALGKASQGVKPTSGFKLILMAGVLLLFVKAVKPIAEMDLGQVLHALFNMALIFTALMGIAELSKRAMDNNIGLNVAGMAAGMLILYFAIKTIGSLSLSTIAKGVGAVAAVMVFMGLMNALSRLGPAKNAAKIEGSFLALSAAILVLGVAINYIGSLELSKIAKGTTAVLAVMAMLTLLGAVMGEAKKATGVVIAMSVCIGLVVASIALLTLLDGAEILTSASALAIAFSGLAIMFKSLEKLKISNAIGAIGLTIIALGAIKRIFIALDELKNPDKLLHEAGSIGLVLVALGASLSLINNNKNLDTANIKRIGKTLLLMGGMLAEVAIVFGVFAVALDKLGSPETLLYKASALGIVLLALGKSISLFNVKTAKLQNIGSTIALIGGISLVAGAITLLLSKFANPEGILWKTTAFAEVLLAMSGAFAIIATISKQLNGIDDGLAVKLGSIAIVTTGLSAVAVLLTRLISLLPDDENLLDKILEFSIVLGEMVAVTAIFSMISKGLEALGKAGFEAIKGAAVAGAIVLALVAFIGLTAVLVIGIGWLFTLLGDIEPQLSAAENIFPRVGAIIGGFFGELVGAFAGSNITEIGKGLENFGTSLSNFAENVKGFIGLNIPPEFDRSIGSLVNAVLAITGAEFIQALLQVDEEAPFKKFGEQLNVFAPEFVKFAETVADIPQDAVLTSATCLEALGTVLANIPTEGGLMGAIFGEKSLDGFGTGLSSVAQGIADYATVLKDSDISQDTINKTNKLTETLIDLANKVPLTGGLMIFFGQHDIGKFGLQLQAYGESLKKFMTSCRIVYALYNEDAFSAMTASTEILIELAETVPKTGGLMMFLGKHDIGKFGEQIELYGWGLAGFFKELENVTIDQGVVDSAKRAGEVLLDIAEDLPKTGGAIQWFAGQSNLGLFGAQIKQFGKGLNSFYTSLTESGLTEDMISLGSLAGKSFVEIANALDPENVKGGFMNPSAFEDFSENLKDLGKGISSFYFNTNGVDWGQVSVAVDNISRIVELSPAMSNLNANAVTHFGTFVALLGNVGIGSFTDTFKNAQGDIMNTVYSTLNSAMIGAKRMLLETPTSYSFIIDSILAGVDGHEDAISERAANVANIVHDTIEANSITFEADGSLIIDSIIKGFDVSDEDLENAIVELAGKMLNDINSELRIQSGASEEFKQIGKYCIDGLVNGLDGNASTAYTKISDIGNNLVSRFEKSLGVNSPSKRFAEVGMYSVLGFNKGIEDNVGSAKDTMVKMGEDLLDAIKEFYGIHSPSIVMKDEVGRYIIQGIAEGITSDMSAEEAAAKKAQNIITAFKSEFDKWSLDINTADLEYKLWSTMHTDATEAEINKQQEELLNKKLGYQAERVNAANAQYQATLRELGAEAKETQEAYNTFLQEQISMYELANELSELMLSDSSTREEAMSKYEQMMKSSDILLKSGFSQDEINQYALKESGLGQYLKQAGGTTSAQEIVDKYLTKEVDVGVIEASLSDKMASAVASGISSGLSSGITNASTGVPDLQGELQNVVSGVVGELGLDLEMFKEGGYIGEGLLDGVRDKLGGFGDTLVSGATNAFNSFRNYFGINSPSTLMYEQGEYIIDGLANSIEDNGHVPTNALVSMADDMNSVMTNMITDWENNGRMLAEGLKNGIESGRGAVISAVVSMSKAALQSSMNTLGIHSPSLKYYYIGEMIDKGLANGIENSSSVIQNAIANVLNDAQFVADNNDISATITPVIDGNLEAATADIYTRQRLSQDAAGTVKPYGYRETTEDDESGWWIGASLDIVQAVQNLSLAEEARRAQEAAMLEEYRSTLDELKVAAKQLADKPADVNFTQNNYSPEALSASTIYRNTKTALATASAAASPTGQSLKSK